LLELIGSNLPTEGLHHLSTNDSYRPKADISNGEIMKVFLIHSRWSMILPLWLTFGTERTLAFNLKRQKSLLLSLENLID